MYLNSQTFPPISSSPVNTQANQQSRSPLSTWAVSVSPHGHIHRRQDVERFHHARPRSRLLLHHLRPTTLLRRHRRLGPFCYPRHRHFHIQSQAGPCQARWV